VRKGRADERERQGAYDADVVDESPLALDERRVLDTTDVVAEQGSRHQISLCSQQNPAEYHPHHPLIESFDKLNQRRGTVR
jgi:hypothetical protein